MFARVKRRADRGGIARHDTRMGAVLCRARRHRRVGCATSGGREAVAAGGAALAQGLGAAHDAAGARDRAPEGRAEREPKREKKLAGEEAAEELERLKAAAPPRAAALSRLLTAPRGS